MTTLKIFLPIILILAPHFLYAGQFKIRAREHFDSHNIEINGRRETYTGLSNTINIWYEEPYDISYGFAFNPVLGGASNDDNPFAELGENIRFIHAGFELKYFFAMERLYTRLGLGWSQLRSDGPLKPSNGYHGYAGLGVEMPIGKVGVALEAAFRMTEVQNEVSAETFTPSIGFHFYEMF